MTFQRLTLFRPGFFELPGIAGGRGGLRRAFTFNSIWLGMATITENDVLISSII